MCVLLWLRTFKYFSNMFIVVVQYTVLLLLLTVPMYTTLSTTQFLLLTVPIVGSATASFKELVAVAQENSTNQAANVLLADLLQPPLDLETVYCQEQEVYKLNSRTECR